MTNIRHREAYLKLKKCQHEIENLGFYTKVEYCTQYVINVWKVPEVFAVDVVFKLLKWKRDNYPPFDILKYLRSKNCKKKTTRKILNNQTMKMLSLFTQDFLKTKQL